MVNAVNALSTLDVAPLQTKLQESNQVKFTTNTTESDAKTSTTSVENKGSSPAFVLDINTSNSTETETAEASVIERSEEAFVTETETSSEGSGTGTPSNSGVNLADQPFDVLDTDQDGKISTQERLEHSRENSENVITSLVDLGVDIKIEEISAQDTPVEETSEKPRNDFFNALLAVQEDSFQLAA